MTPAEAIVRVLIEEGGYDLPDGPSLPPLDVAEGAARALAVTLSELARALGVETDPIVTRSLFQPARSRTEIRLALAKVHLALTFAAVEMGFPSPAADPVPDGLAADFAAMLSRLRTKRLD